MKTGFFAIKRCNQIKFYLAKKKHEIKENFNSVIFPNYNQKYIKRA